jgi:hypothetical protein
MGLAGCLRSGGGTLREASGAGAVATRVAGARGGGGRSCSLFVACFSAIGWRDSVGTVRLRQRG